MRLRLPFACASATAFLLAIGISAIAPVAAQTPPPASQAVTQASAGNTVLESQDNSAGASDSAFQNATGNIGYNAAAGNGNMQANVTYLDTGSPPYTVSSALAQGSAGNSVFSGDANVASFELNAFQNASGNIGANAAAGALNQQINAAIVSDADDFAGTTGTIQQIAIGNSYSSSDANYAGTDIEDAELTNAFQNVSGNIGVNLAAGNGNQQANQILLGSKTTDGTTTATYPLLQGVAQGIGSNSVASSDANDASADDFVFQNASGTVGFNAAAGNGNQQGNTLFLDEDADSPFAFTGTYIQAALSNSVESGNANFASFFEDAFQNASGNIGANAASGNLNQQLNAAVILTGKELASSTSSLTQASSGSGYLTSDNNSAGVFDNAFQNASGNIGVNVAAGNGNMQANTLLISH